MDRRNLPQKVQVFLPFLTGFSVPTHKTRHQMMVGEEQEPALPWLRRLKGVSEWMGEYDVTRIADKAYSPSWRP